jgi:uncharacterized membrane protein (TIGR02234 family)
MSALLVRRSVVLIALVGAGLVLLAATRTWATVEAVVGLPGLSELTVPARHLAPSAIPVALAVAAGAIVLATSGLTVRLVVAAGLLVGGVVVVISGVSGALDSSRTTAIAVRDSLKVSGAGFTTGSTPVDVTIWPWVAVLGGVLIGLSGLLTVLGGRSWAGPSRRYEREKAPVPVAADPGSSGTAAYWDALSRGEDPTSALDEPT